MVVIKPFRGSHFDVAKVGDINLVAAPPHDVISEEEKIALLGKSKYNSVRIILPDSDYESTAGLLQEFVTSGALVRDDNECYYIYEQEFKYYGSTKRRMGLLALIKAERLGEDVLPHEKTFPDKIEDRVNLFLSSKASLSPIFGIYRDDGKEVYEILVSERNGKPIIDFISDDGVINRVWRISETETLTGIFRGKKIIIADGHHRYTAASRIAEITEGKNEFTLIYLVDKDDPALAILPTHRLIKAPHFNVNGFLTKALEFFNVEVLADITELEQRLESAGPYSFGLHTKNSSHFLMLKEPGVIEDLVDGGSSTEWKHLDVSVLHGIILDKLLQIPDENVAFAKHNQDIIDLIDDGTYDAAFLLRSTSMHEIDIIARNGEVMPHKSTYFYPKPMSGVIMQIDETTFMGGS